MPKSRTEFKKGDKVVQRSFSGPVLTVKGLHPLHALAGAFVLLETGTVTFEEGQQDYAGFTNFTADFMLAEERLAEIQNSIRALSDEAERIKKALG